MVPLESFIQLAESTVEKNTLLGAIDGIKCDCMAQDYRWKGFFQFSFRLHHENGKG